MSQQQDTSPDTKRKKEFVLGFYVSANEFSDSRIVNLIREHGPLGYTVFSCARCLMRGVAELKLSLSDANKDVAWILHSDANVVDTIIDHCITVGLFSSDGESIWCDEMIADVARLDKRRQQLIEAGSKGGSAKAKLQAKSKHKLKHTPVRYGTVRNGTIDDLRNEDLSTLKDQEIRSTNSISIPPSEVEHLLTLISEDEYRYWLEELTDFSKSQPAKWRKYKDHGAVLRAWRRKRLQDGYTWDALKKTYRKPTWKEQQAIPKRAEEDGFVFLRKLIEEEEAADGKGS